MSKKRNNGMTENERKLNKSALNLYRQNHIE